MTEEKNKYGSNSIGDDIKSDAEVSSEEEALKNAEDLTEENLDSDADGAESDEDKQSEAQESESKEEEEALYNKYLMLMADFQNFKRRVEKEKSDIYAYANEKLVVELLSVLDNFERALGTDSGDEAFRAGMEMILKQLWTVLEKSGLAEIKAEGEEFDPNFHNAVMMESRDDFESNKVTEVLQKGYTLNGKVIRPTMVKVNS